MDQEFTLKEAKKLLILDAFALEDACVSQSEVFYRIASKCSEAISIRDQKKEQIAILSARLACSYREHSIKVGEKITESKLNQMVLIDEQYIKESSEWLESKKEADLWGTLKDSFMQRASMIKELCGLYISGYFTDISLKSNKSMEEVTHLKQREKGRSLRKGRSIPKREKEEEEENSHKLISKRRTRTITDRSSDSL